MTLPSLLIKRVLTSPGREVSKTYSEKWRRSEYLFIIIFSLRYVFTRMLDEISISDIDTPDDTRDRHLPVVFPSVFFGN